ncbi:MAG: hypothetical protein KGI08_08840 [Thaumarchaeota archaeon]|nr:hypothetical protein [Nitrososphaerota archaeon]
METKETYQVWAGGYRESLVTVRESDIQGIIWMLLQQYPDSTIMISKEIHGVTHKDWLE